MKKLTYFLCTLILVLGLVGAAQAVPMYYTFEGTVTGITNPDGISGLGPALGEKVTYQFEIDSDVVGTYTTFGGITADYAVYPSYLTDYIGGSALPEPEVGYYSVASQTAEYNYGYEHPVGHVAYIRANSLNNLLDITLLGSPGTADEWGVGIAARASNRYWFKDPDTGVATLTTLYANNLTLTKVSDTYPGGGAAQVPEPSTMLLLGTGLVGLAGFGRRKFKKS